jgi:hypothetical protein
MKTTIRTLCIALCITLGASASALADRGRDYGHRDYRPAPQHYGERHHHGSRHNHGHRDHYSRSWVGPAAALAITGLAVGAVASQYYSPRPVYVAPVQPAYVAPPANYWHYCASAGQYHPYVQYCPEPWQIVYPR